MYTNRDTMSYVAAFGVRTARTMGVWSMSRAQAATDAAAWVAARQPSPPAMARRCATTENVLPTVSGTRSLRLQIERPRGAVPHHLPGTNASVREFAHKHAIPFDATRGGAATMYPDYMTRLRPVGPR